jgi:hypothetical protein
MKAVKPVLAVICGTLALFLFSALSQFLPWGVPTAETYTTVSGDPGVFAAPDLIRLKPYELTTPRFDTELVGKISTLETDQTFSWIISTPMTAYSPIRYFTFEALTQGIVALSLYLLLRCSGVGRRFWGLVICASISAGAATYGSLMNWWGLPAAYALGAAANMVIGWLLGAWVMVQFMPRKESRAQEVQP